MSSIPKLYNNGSQLSRSLLNSSITDLFHLQILSQHKQFVTNIKYFQNQQFSIITPYKTDLVTYIIENGYYIINISWNKLNLPMFSMFENIIELYNISRNETYFMLSKNNNNQTFTQPCEFVEIIEDVETSLYRITGFLSKQSVIENLIFTISSSYTNKAQNSLYFLKHIGNKEYSIYEIELSENSIESEINNILNIIQSTDDENIDLSLLELIGIIKKETNITINQNETINFDDITLNCNYYNNDYDYLQYLNISDILYFYVNRLSTPIHNHDLTYEKKSNKIMKTDTPSKVENIFGYKVVENEMDMSSVFIDWANGNIQKLIINENLDLYFICPDINYGFEQTLFLIQNNIGNYTITLKDSNIKWLNNTENTFDISQNAVNILKIIYDGQTYFIELKN